MRRVILVAITALVIAALAWALWPATTWPRAFCAPVLRIVGSDASALFHQVQNKNGFVTPNKTGRDTPTEQKLVSTLRADVILAEGAAPTSQLRSELHTYAERLHGGRLSIGEWTLAMSTFDVKAGDQLGACGVVPLHS